MPLPLKKSIYGVKDNQIQEVDDGDVDYDLVSPNSFFSTHVNLIPLQSSVQGPRLFYGARFYNQALPLKNAEAPLVQNIDDEDPEGGTFDHKLGKLSGAMYAEEDGEIDDIQNDHIILKAMDGQSKKLGIYYNFPFNRKTGVTQTPLVKKGDKVTKGQLIAKSNFTDDNGNLSLGMNARVGLVPYKGYSFEDALVISSSFAKKLSSDHSTTTSQQFDHDIKGGLSHYKSLFPTQFTKKQIELLDDDGVVKPGTMVNPNDPLILATRPRVFSSTTSQLGKLSRAMKQSRHDSSKVWDGENPGMVTDVAKTSKGVKVVVQTTNPTQVGDKVVFRSGQKGVVSTIIDDERMPRTTDGQPLEVLLNPLGIPSRANNSMIYELLLGKVAKKIGQAIKVNGFNKKGEKWHEIVRKHLDDAGLTETEEVFDPTTNRKLGQPITVGIGHVLKLHHTSASKLSSRSQGGYDCYDEDTEVLTRRGWIPWNNVLRNDEFFTVIDNQATYRKATRIVEYDYNGDMLGFESKYLSWLTTPKHQHLIKQKAGWKKISADDLSSKRRFSVRQFGFGVVPGTSPDFVEIPAPKFSQKKRRNKEWKSNSIRIDDYAEFVGWWISEGSVVFDEEKNRYRVYIWQHDGANPTKSKSIRALLDRLPFSDFCNHYDVNGNIVGYWISDAGLAQHLIEKYGTKCGKKRIWRDVFTWSPSHRSALLRNAMLGDGSKHIHKNSTGRKSPNIIEVYTTTSELLADDIQELCISLGFGAMISETPERINNKGYLCSKSFSVGLHRNRTDATARVSARYDGKHVIVPYKGKVYCATIPDSGLLYVRRNKKPLLSGNSDQQPLKGGGDSAQAKRLSGLEVHSLLSAGAYATLREGATLRGQKNDEYWRSIRSGLRPKPLGRPFVWDKFRALISGAGMHTKEMGDGRLRLGPLTDDILEKQKPFEIQSGDMVDINTLEPIKGGLFDQSIVGNNKWGKIKLPFAVPNPAFESSIRSLLGLTEKELRGILSGEQELPSHLM